MTGNILLIDDDAQLTAMLGDYLNKEGFDVTSCIGGQQGIELLRSNTFDLVVLDIMMPVMDGLETLKRIRKISYVPVLILTAKGDDTNRILGLELGADDYVSKPCTPREIVARINAILRRTMLSSPKNKSVPIQISQLTLWPGQRRAQWQEHELELTSTEFSLLEVLVKHAGEPVTKQFLSEQCLGRPLERYDRSIDVHVSSLRQKIGAFSGDEPCIQTIYRVGYQFVKE